MNTSQSTRNNLQAAVLLGICLLSSSTKAADTLPSMTQEHQFKATVTREVQLGYVLRLPEGYDAAGDKEWPLLFFLHGRGESGSDLSRVGIHGPLREIRQGRTLPFIVLAPQCPEDRVWDDDALLALLDTVVANHKVDTNRVYLTGLSMGGFGTWSLGLKHADRFAALAPICGGGNRIDVLLASRRNADALKPLGIWVFHGAKDPVVPLSESERMVDALKRAGKADVKLTVYPEAQHDSWSETYANPAFYDWLLQHSR